MPKPPPFLATTKREDQTMDQDQQRDYSEEQYNRHLCPDCDYSPCIGDTCTGEATQGRTAVVDDWLQSLRMIRKVLDSAANQEPEL